MPLLTLMSLNKALLYISSNNNITHHLTWQDYTGLLVYGLHCLACCRGRFSGRPLVQWPTGPQASDVIWGPRV